LRSADVAGNYTPICRQPIPTWPLPNASLDQAEYLYKNGISSERDYTEAKENYNKAVAANRK
jgi:cobalt-zinc-cadmium efflux system membrane fusion protein